MNLIKQINWSRISLGASLSFLITLVLMVLLHRLSFLGLFITTIMYPIFAIVFSVKKKKGCLSEKTHKMKTEYFENLYNFKDIDPIFLLEQSRDLLDDEFDQFTVWIFDDKYSSKGLIKSGSIITTLTDEQQHYITLIARLNTELIDEKIITPVQKQQIEKYILGILLKKQ